ncbi:MAG: hypothetical protein Q9P44_18585 [Anaerolineae bacterium]|nr:hypothetical protein [Anaerolineae bacterium]
MRKILLLCLLLGLMVFGGAVSAQDGSPTSTISYLFVACENHAVIDFEGTMQPGYDIYVQVFLAQGASGTQLTNLIRVSVNNEYQVSQTLNYANGQTVLIGQFASAQISMARENDPSSTIFSDTVQDAQDNCAEPSFPSADTTDAGSSGSSITTPIIDPVTGNVIDFETAEVVGSSGIFTPDGGVLNDIIVRQAESVVQIGARPSEQVEFVGRTADPGLIFAECDLFAGANPGLLWDTDNLTVFWSWFAATPELVQEHLDTAQYEVFFTSPYTYRQIFPRILVSQITQREDGNYWVFYTANLGDGFRPGQYRIDYYVTWNRAISDGYETFGPGTQNEGLLSTCTFNVEVNPFGLEIRRDNPTVPLQRGS